MTRQESIALAKRLAIQRPITPDDNTPGNAAACYAKMLVVYHDYDPFMDSRRSNAYYVTTYETYIDCTIINPDDVEMIIGYYLPDPANGYHKAHFEME